MPKPEKHALNQVITDILDRDYWASICPDLHVCDDKFLPRNPLPDFQVDWSDEVIDACRDSLVRDGFFTLDVHSAIPEEVISNTRNGILILLDHGWHPNFIAIYDEPWRIAHSIADAVRRITGGNEINFDWLAYFVPPEGRGMPPHRDFHHAPPESFNSDGTPRVATCWISLGYSGPDNGCLYMLPKHADARYMTSSTTETPADVFVSPATYQDIRAFPLAPGEAVMFSHRVYHWGAASTRDAAEPRVAIAVGLSDPQYKAPYATAEALPSPPLPLRAALCAAQMLIYSYRHMGPWPLTDDYRLDLRTLAFLRSIFETYRDAFDATFVRTVARSPIMAEVDALLRSVPLDALLKEARETMVVAGEGDTTAPHHGVVPLGAEYGAARYGDDGCRNVTGKDRPVGATACGAPPVATGDATAPPPRCGARVGTEVAFVCLGAECDPRVFAAAFGVTVTRTAVATVAGVRRVWAYPVDGEDIASAVAAQWAALGSASGAAASGGTAPPGLGGAGGALAGAPSGLALAYEEALSSCVDAVVHVFAVTARFLEVLQVECALHDVAEVPVSVLCDLDTSPLRGPRGSHVIGDGAVPAAVSDDAMRWDGRLALALFRSTDRAARARIGDDAFASRFVLRGHSTVWQNGPDCLLRPSIRVLRAAVAAIATMSANTTVAATSATDGDTPPVATDAHPMARMVESFKVSLLIDRRVELGKTPEYKDASGL